jgi:hypothetical protein
MAHSGVFATFLLAVEQVKVILVIVSAAGNDLNQPAFSLEVYLPPSRKAKNDFCSKLVD